MTPYRWTVPTFEDFHALRGAHLAPTVGASAPAAPTAADPAAPRASAAHLSRSLAHAGPHEIRVLEPPACRLPGCTDVGRVSSGFCCEAHEERYFDLRADADRELEDER